MPLEGISRSKRSCGIIKKEEQEVDWTFSGPKATMNMTRRSAIFFGLTSLLVEGSLYAQCVSVPTDAEGRDHLSSILSKLFVSQGGFNNSDPVDTGGPTKFGITLTDLEKWRGRPLAAEDIMNLAPAEAIEIYRATYWTPLLCNQMPYGVDYTVFDTGVLNGLGTSARFLQKACGVATAQTINRVTPEFVSEIRNHDGHAIIRSISQQRRDRFTAIVDREPIKAKYLAGWNNRVNTVESSSLAMVGTERC
jgi:lysozyme family protein